MDVCPTCKRPRLKIEMREAFFRTTQELKSWVESTRDQKYRIYGFKVFYVIEK